MTFPSPIQDKLENYAVEIVERDGIANRQGAPTGSFQAQLLCEFLPWGDSGCFVLATTGIVEIEYSTMRKSASIFDAPCRGTIEVTGTDYFDFIERMTTQKLSDMNDGESRLAFITSRKGTIVSDVIVHKLADRILIDLDITVVQTVCDHLNSYIVMENVEIENKTGSVHWMWCIGSKVSVIEHKDAQTFVLPECFLGLDCIAIATKPDTTLDVWESYVSSGVRPVGWYALNMLRVECGIPFFMIDFESNNLPHETGLVHSRVSFEKGCYLGQEIIARMESLGQPKQQLVKLSITVDELPVSGAQLWSDDSTNGTPIGVVTSSAISPMGGSVPVAIAMVLKKCNTIGTSVFTNAGSDVVECKVELI